MKKQIFSILLPPPNISGSLHMGHALNFFLQDFLGKTASISLLYEKSQLLPGLDHGGISTQYSSLKAIKNLSTLCNEEKFTIIKNFAEDAKNQIVQQMENFSLTCDLSQIKYTMSPEHIQLVNKSFVTLYNRGLIKEEERIIYWDPIMKTSLSNLEVIHKTVEEQIFYIKYQIYNSPHFVTVATTRPETLFGDVALAVGKKYKELINEKVMIPIINKIIPIIFDESVDDNFGTGILKITPAHDENDFYMSKKHNLPLINILDENLKLNNHVPLAFQGLSVEEARILILKNIQVEKIEKITHSVMFGDKSGGRIETILKKQWYLDLSNAAKKALELLDKGEFKIFPQQWESTYRKWLENLRPWCISREILWGHQIPVWRTKNEKKIIVAVSENEALLQANGDEIIRDHFLLDTWFSSGLWPLLYKQYPTTVLVTAYDIIFFWVARMVMMCLELDNSLPFQNVLIHNLLRDGVGEKMSKTRGNVQDPMDIINHYGNTDILRFGLLSKITIRGQIRFSAQDLENAEKLITKIKNAIRFLETNYKKEDFIALKSIDQIYIKNEICIHFLEKFDSLKLMDLLEDYNIYKYINNLYNFFWNDYCDWFLEMSKKQLFDEDIKFTLIFIMKNILKYFYGILPTLTEEIYTRIFQEKITIPIKKISMIYGTKKTNISDFIYFIQQIRSLKHILNGTVLLGTFPLINEDKIYESLKINTITPIKKYKYLLIRSKKLYFLEVQEEQLMLLKKKKIIELNDLNQRITKEIPPIDILQEFEYRKKMLEEEILLLESYNQE